MNTSFAFASATLVDLGRKHKVEPVVEKVADGVVVEVDAEKVDPEFDYEGMPDLIDSDDDDDDDTCSMPCLTDHKPLSEPMMKLRAEVQEAPLPKNMVAFFPPGSSWKTAKVAAQKMVGGKLLFYEQKVKGVWVSVPRLPMKYCTSLKVKK